MAGRKKAAVGAPEITLFTETSETPVNIEGTFEKLDTIIEQMEAPGISLERSLELYKQAVTLADGMKAKLTQIHTEIDAIGNEGA